VSNRSAAARAAAARWWRIPLRQLAVAVGVGLVEPVDRRHRPFLECQQVVAVLV
jgi:hypothetical protein